MPDTDNFAKNPKVDFRKAGRASRSRLGSEVENKRDFVGAVILFGSLLKESAYLQVL